MSTLLSFVLCSRNDGYPEGNGIKLLNFATNNLINRLAKIKSKFEIIIVEYNPPAKKEPLYRCLKLKKSRNIKTKIITVSKEFHIKLNNFKEFPLCQELALNIGIQRSKGKYVIIKMADTIYSDSFFEFLKSFNFNQNYLYRCGRKDFAIENFLQNDFSNINQIENNTTCGDFFMMSKAKWNIVRGYWENGDAYQDGADTILKISALNLNIKEKFLPDVFILKPTHNLLYEKRTNYDYYKVNFYIVDQLLRFIRGILIRLNFINRKAEIKSRDGSGKIVKINIYCYDLKRKIDVNKKILPLNKHKNWGLKNINLNEKKI